MRVSAIRSLVGHARAACAAIALGAVALPSAGLAQDLSSATNEQLLSELARRLSGGAEDFGLHCEHEFKVNLVCSLLGAAGPADKLKVGSSVNIDTSAVPQRIRIGDTFSVCLDNWRHSVGVRRTITGQLELYEVGKAQEKDCSASLGR